MTTPTEPFALRPTALERRMGRLLRGPDGHGDADGGAGGDAGDAGADGGNKDAGGDTDAGDAGNEGDGGDKGGQGDGQGGDGDGAGGDATSLIGEAAAKARAGKDKEGGDGGEGDADAGGDKEGDGDDDGKDADVPEAYDLSGLKVTLKDDKGEDVEVDLEIDTALLDLATPHLKEAKLDNDQAKTLAPLVLGIKERAIADQNDAYEAVAANWAKEVKADKELGGKNWGTTEHNMGRAFDRYGSPELDTLLNESRLGNHPAFVRFFAKVGAELGEDEGGHRGAGATDTKKDRSAVLYPDDQPKS